MSNVRVRVPIYTYNTSTFSNAGAGISPIEHESIGHPPCVPFEAPASAQPAHLSITQTVRTELSGWILQPDPGVGSRNICTYERRPRIRITSFPHT